MPDFFSDPRSELAPDRVGSPVMYQTWERLTFLHWRYEPKDIRRLLPKGMQLDTFDGSAWVGLTPFVLTGLRLPGIPAMPWISNFPEMNVRTYVLGPTGERGIWFFTLEAKKLHAVLGARLFYGLPYRWAKMSVRGQADVVQYRSDRVGGHGKARITVQVGSPMQPGARERFLTARYRLYTRIAGRLAFARVDHEPWPLHEALVSDIEQDVIKHSGVPAPVGEPLAWFSPAVHVRVERPRFV